MGNCVGHQGQVSQFCIMNIEWSWMGDCYGLKDYSIELVQDG